jgi:hypothetical protein
MCGSSPPRTATWPSGWAELKDKNEALAMNQGFKGKTQDLTPRSKAHDHASGQVPQ